MNQQQFSTKDSSSSANDMTTTRREPPIWFDLTEISPDVAMKDMQTITDQFKSITDMDFLEQLYSGIRSHYTYYGVKPVIIGYIPAPPKSNPNSNDVVKKVIGTKGYWLKVTTENCGVHFIWYEPSMNYFLFWAPDRASIVRAMKAIRRRIIKYWEFKYQTVEYEEDEYADIPDLVYEDGSICNNDFEQERRGEPSSCLCGCVRGTENCYLKASFPVEDRFAEPPPLLRSNSTIPLPEMVTEHDCGCLGEGGGSCEMHWNKS